MAFVGRMAIVAGGLGGIGSSAGRMLIDQGAKLAVLYAPFEAAKAPALLKSNYDDRHQEHITALPCDITDPASVEQSFEKIESGLGSGPEGPVIPNMLINSAGYVSLSKMEETPPEETMKNININIIGSMFTSQAFARLYLRLREQRTGSSLPGGRIVNMSSQAGHVALPLHGAYCASKAGLLGLTRSMAAEWGPKGITANSVSPTVVWTTLGQKAWADVAVREAFQKKIPTGRFAEPSEVASAIEYLCRDESGMINGADIRVDGGFTIT